MVWTLTLWFKEVEKPPTLQSEGKGAMTTQMKAWVALTIQVNLGIGLTDLRDVLTCAALNMWPYLYDLLAPSTSKWCQNGGAAAYFR